MNAATTRSTKTVYCCLPLILAGVLTLTGNCSSDQDSPAEDRSAPHPPSEAASAAAADASKRILVSGLAGRWYVADPEILRAELDGYYQKAKTETKENVIALILPHAGYQYSGATAMAGLKSLGKRKFRRVVVMGPSHSLALSDTLSVPDVTHYQTPLGQTPLDVPFLERLKEYGIFQSIPLAHQYEHSVQIELPLLQYLDPDFQLVPIVVGTLRQETVLRAAAILRSLIDENTLVIGSSDFTHYGPDYRYEPYKNQNDIPGKVKALDLGAYEWIAKLDVEGFLAYREQTGCTICGYMPIAILLWLLPKNAQTHLIAYNTSGDLTGDWSHSVSYAAVAFTGAWIRGPEVKPNKGSTRLTPEDKKALLQLARGSLEYYLETGQVATPEQLDIPVTEPMRQVKGSFVTLQCTLEHLQSILGQDIKRNAKPDEPAAEEWVLRGCIGEMFPVQQLYSSVMLNAIKSAVADRRFPNVTWGECPELRIEISVLTPPVAVADFRKIELGRHGIVLKKDGRTAVFLPQVAPEQGWTLAETLTQLSRKAGLPADAWKEGAEYLVFEAIVFGEHEFPELRASGKTG